MDEIISAILKDTYSLAQLKHRLRILKANLLLTFFGGSEQDSISPADLAWLKSLPAAFYQKFTRENVYKIFSELDDAALKLNVLTLYLSFDADEGAVSQIGSYGRRTFNAPFLLLDIKKDPALIAGTAISWKGVYRDYSLRSRMALKKNELWEGFKKFLR